MPINNNSPRDLGTVYEGTAWQMLIDVAWNNGEAPYWLSPEYGTYPVNSDNDPFFTCFNCGAQLIGGCEQGYAHMASGGLVCHDCATFPMSADVSIIPNDSGATHDLDYVFVRAGSRLPECMDSESVRDFFSKYKLLGETVGADNAHWARVMPVVFSAWFEYGLDAGWTLANMPVPVTVGFVRRVTNAPDSTLRCECGHIPASMGSIMAISVEDLLTLRHPRTLRMIRETAMYALTRSCCGWGTVVPSSFGFWISADGYDGEYTIHSTVSGGRTSGATYHVTREPAPAVLPPVICGYHGSGHKEPIGKSKRRVFRGVELEVLHNDRYRDTNTDARRFRDVVGEGVVFFETDSSITADGGSGFEIITAPMTTTALKAHRDKIATGLGILASEGYRSHDTTTCGLHIHLSRTAFGQVNSERNYNIMKLLYAVENNWDEIVKLSRRNDRSLRNYANRVGSLDLSVLDDYARDGDRYNAINTTNSHTVEMRIFRGTLNVETFYACIDFFPLLAAKTKTMTVRRLTKTKGLRDLLGKNIPQHISDYMETRGV